MARVLGCGIAFYTVLLGSAVVSPPVAELCMRRFHTDLPFAVWALSQPAPSMYAYTNEAVFIGPRGFRRTQAVNHHTYRMISERSRWWTRKTPRGTGWILLRSTYRGQAVRTRFTVTLDANGATLER